jgi:tetratricopeptide (TPR) repeat protein
VRLRLAGRAARRLTRLRAQAPALVSTVEIARLWETAGDCGRAAVLYERAARSAAAEGADSACAQGLRRALDLFETASDTDTPRRAIRWLAELSRAQWSLGQVDVANLNARKAIERARREPLVLPRRLRTQALAASGLRIETGQFLGDVAEILVGAVDAGRFGAAVPEAAITRSRGFSALGYGLGLFRLSAAADQVLKRGELLASPGDGRPAAYVLTSRAMVDFVFARWREGEAALAAARSQCASLPAHQLMEWIETTCGIGAHLQGRGERALEHFAVLADLAQRRGSDMHAGWADYASAQTLLALDRPHEAWARLNAADDRLRNVVDRQSHHICLGLRARIAWRLGEVDEALAAAAACGTLGRQLAPTNHTSTEAFSAPALVGALALVGEVSAAQRRLARRLVRRHMAEFGRYALVFPIARPRLALTRGLLLARRSPARARQSLDAALRRANSLGLRFEADLARQAHDLVVDHLA